MSFIYGEKKGEVYAPGYFLAHEECVRKTQTISATGVTADAYGHKHVKAGTIWPSNDANAVGIVYEDVDVTAGDMPGSVVMSGVVYTGRLPVAPASAAKTALEGKGFAFLTEPTVTRPDDGAES